MVPDARVAITHNISPAIAASDAEEDVRAAVALDAIQNRTFVDPCLLGADPSIEDMGVPIDLMVSM